MVTSPDRYTCSPALDSAISKKESWSVGLTGDLDRPDLMVFGGWRNPALEFSFRSEKEKETSSHTRTHTLCMHGPFSFFVSALSSLTYSLLLLPCLGELNHHPLSPRTRSEARLFRTRMLSIVEFHLDSYAAVNISEPLRTTTTFM